jgi:hypothetical protein
MHNIYGPVALNYQKRLSFFSKYKELPAQNDLNYIRIMNINPTRKAMNNGI